MKILRNAARCRKCGDEIESTHRHDFRWCSCHRIAVDGGRDYLKRCGDLQNFEERSIQLEESFEEFASGVESYSAGGALSALEAWLRFFQQHAGTVHLKCYETLPGLWFAAVPLNPRQILFAATGEGSHPLEALRATARVFWEIGNREAK